MAKKKSATPMGRPKIPMITPDIGEFEKKIPPKPIDLRQVLYWIDMSATQEEIAGSFFVSVDTLNRRIQEELGITFAELKKRCCGGAKLALRRNQFKMTEKNASMAIWLGKQWLGQKDNDRDTITPPHDAHMEMIQQLLLENKQLKVKLNGIEHKTNRSVSGGGEED